MEIKNRSFKKNLVILIFYAFLFNTAFGMSLLKLQTFNPTLLSKTIYNEVDDSFMETLPPCQVNDQLHLMCHTSSIFIQEFSDFTFVVNSENQSIPFISEKPQLVFNKDQFILKKNQSQLTFDYKNFQSLDFKGYSSSTIFIDDLASRIFLTLRPQILFPLILFSYIMMTGILLIFCLGLSLFGFLLNFGGSQKYSYKQFVNIVVKSAFIPCLISIGINFLFSPLFGIFIFQILTALFFLYMYKNVIKGNFS